MTRMPMASERQVLSVRALTLYIKNLLDRDALLSGVWVRGELSNARLHTSGHLYFTLKDETSAIRGVMFRSKAQRLRFRPDNGMRVIVAGYVTVYEATGQYQLYAEEMQPDGVGALHLAFEQMKARLAAEGLFDPALKRPLPLLPRKVGVVTSPTGAAVRDIITVARRRFPNAHLVVAPALVQGEEAPASIVRALGQIARVPGVDVVIVGRGGGSLEELWAFNSEEVARAIRACPLPVVAAIGHETDTTIADFAADVRAATPSAAAELVLPVKGELRERLQQQERRLAGALRARVERARERLDLLLRRPVLQRPQDRVRQARQRLDELIHRLGYAAGRGIAARRSVLSQAGGRLDALSPLKVLARGYSIVYGRHGAVLRAASQVKSGDELAIRLAEGRLTARVTSVQDADAPTAKQGGEPQRD